ncbi:LysM peptidoglycan-binding domain-containing protein [bacterium]|nr:LysM peptidoglycan-binding domain-containing protein [bacterium]MCP5462476.1 LysM peptidoglycan-binding domain-containing protein [bacterium]
MKRLFLILLIPVAFSGCITQQEFEQRETYTQNEISRLNDHNLTLENRFEELSTMLIKLSQDYDRSLAQTQSDIKALENQLNNSVNTRMNEFSDELKKKEAGVDDKLKVILDEVLKENQRIVKRIRMIEKGLYGQETQQESISTERTSSETTATSSQFTAQEHNGYVSHMVKSGENLWSIAQNYGITMEAIAEANHMESISDIIKPGQLLQIPVKSE